ncbi:MAG: FtsQ-type POTRA domain-containing protein [Rhizomicrobium sp.]|jgi:cell division protein FtsQ
MRKAQKTRGGRGRQSRSPARGVSRGAAQQPFGRRKKPPNNPISRLIGRVRAFLSFRRPMLVMTLGIIALTALAALFASGVIGRTVHRAGAAVDAIVADAGFGIAKEHLTGNLRTAPVTIQAVLGFKPGQSIFTANLPGARARLLRLPWVAKAEVKRRYPDDISVRIVEKQPFARYQSPKELYVVERSGGLITDRDIEPFRNLPLLVGDGAPQAAAPFVDAVAQHRAIVARVQAYQYQSARRWNLLLDDGVIVKLPETGWRKQLDALEYLIVDKGILERDLAEIDLRSPTQYFFVTKPGEQKEKKTERGSAI